MDTVLQIIDAHRDTVRGIKVSLLDPALEIALRERMPACCTAKADVRYSSDVDRRLPRAGRGDRIRGR
ncbi:hypothetical protein Pd630_LPD06619 [Rhodococcus opacus PD630]|nr:hypothetical protein Pd630_LPD06619 [Rhodococcus opacus PD630]